MKLIMDEKNPPFIPMTIDASVFITGIILFVIIYIVTFLLLKRRGSNKLYLKSLIISISMTIIVMLTWIFFCLQFIFEN